MLFTYRVSLGLYLIDYYTDEHTEYAPDVYTFVGESVWQARLQVRLFLLQMLKDTTIVRFYKTTIEVCNETDAVWHALGQWDLYENTAYRWDWEAEERFLTKHQVYRQGDQELLTLEKIYYQTPAKETAKREAIAQQLGVFVGKHKTEIKRYAIEIGLLYLLVGKLEEAFFYLTMHVSPSLLNLTYSLAMRLPAGYMKRFDALYPKGRPPWGL